MMPVVMTTMANISSISTPTNSHNLHSNLIIYITNIQTNDEQGGQAQVGGSFRW